MERHCIEWEQLGTHDEHLSVMDFKKVQRVKEVTALEETISEKQEELMTLHEKEANTKSELEDFLSRLVDVKNELHSAENEEKFIVQHASHYDNDPDYQLLEPRPLMTAKNYHEKIAAPLVQRLKNVIRSILSQFFEQVKELKTALDRAERQNWRLSRQLKKYEVDNEKLKGVARDYMLLRHGLGDQKADGIVSDMKVLEMSEKKLKSKLQAYER